MRLGTMFMDIFKSFFTPPVTEKYPFEKPKTAPRFRGRLHFEPAKCTGCNLCAKDCPADALEIVILDRAAKRYVARYNIDKCAYCGQCIQSCKFKCITMPNDDWELAALSKEKFTAFYGKEDDVANLMDKLAHQSLPRKQDNRLSLPRTCLVGIGSDLRGDDSAGLVAVRQLLKYPHAENFLIIEGGSAPENVTGKLRAFHPDLVILIDAAHIDEPPGTVQWIPLESIDGMSASSHSLPLSMLASYLTAEIGCDVSVLGIQPAQNEIGFELSPSVQTAVDEITKELSNLFSASVYPFL